MYYIIGSRQQIRNFQNKNRIPYFRYEELDTYTGVVKLYNEEDERATMYSSCAGALRKARRGRG